MEKLKPSRCTYPDRRGANRLGAALGPFGNDKWRPALRDHPQVSRHCRRHQMS